MEKKFISKRKLVTAAGIGINLALGILYTWSIFKVAISQSIKSGMAGGFDWSPSALNDPYAVCCLVFACGMIIAGKSQDKFGPRLTAIIGGVLAGLGFILISQTTAYFGWIIGFGLLVGLGIAFGYSSATPPALKWYPPAKTGRIAGIVVAGFGLAAVYISPLAKYLLDGWGMQSTMLFFGIAFLVVVSLMAMLLVNPPEGYVPEDFTERRTNKKTREMFKENVFKPSEMIRTRVFWILWALYFIGAGAGLMVIGSIAGMAQSSLGESAFLAVAILAIGNAAGRVVAGMLSDRVGRSRTLAGIFIFQAALMLMAIPIVGASVTSAPLLVLLATLIGFNYGANLALFPSFSKDLWGMKNFGVNYGILFTAWGFGGLIMSRVSQSILAETGSYDMSFMIAAGLLAAGALTTYFIQDGKEAKRRQISKQEGMRYKAAA